MNKRKIVGNLLVGLPLTILFLMFCYWFGIERVVCTMLTILGIFIFLVIIGRGMSLLEDRNNNE